MATVCVGNAFGRLASEKRENFTKIFRTTEFFWKLFYKLKG